MQRFTVLSVAAVVLIGAGSRAFAQADAQAAFQQAKTALQAGRFVEARDAAQKASQTDPKNPEVFLLLGKAHYELGELDDAVTAWKRTLALAPDEAFAKKMLDAVQARQTDVDTRIKLVAALIGEKLYPPAMEECRNLLANKALGKAQRAKVMTLLIHVAIGTSQPAEAVKGVQEVVALYPQQVDPIEIAVLMGQAKVRIGGEGTAQGIAILKDVVSKHAGTAAGAIARYELITFDLEQGVDAVRADALAKWIAENPKYPQVREGRQKLIEAYLALTDQGSPATPEGTLAGTDLQALAVAHELLAQPVRADEAAAVAQNFSRHFESHYAARGAWSAAEEGLTKLFAEPLPRTARLQVGRGIVKAAMQLAAKYLDQERESGRLATADPKSWPNTPLTRAVVWSGKIGSEDRAHTAWGDLITLGTQVRAAGASLPWPDRVTALRTTDAWAVAILLPVVQANGDVKAVEAALNQCHEIVGDYGRREEATARSVRVDLSRQIAAAVSPEHPTWPGAMQAHAAVLDGYARFLFAENLKAGRAEDNAKLSAVQKELLDTLAKLVARHVSTAAAALTLAAEHVKLWTEHGQWAVAEEFYATLAKALPAAERGQAELAIVHLWIRQVVERDQRLTAAGMTVPRELDPTMKKALLKLYELQAGLEPTSPKLQPIRGAWDSIVRHYQALQYDDVAEAAIRVKPEGKVDLKSALQPAEEYAAFQLIKLQEWRARRDLARQLKQYGAKEKIALTPELKATLDAWTKFIAVGAISNRTGREGAVENRAAPKSAIENRTYSPLAAQAVEQVFGIGRLFEQQGAPDVAAVVYGDFAKFAAGVKTLSQAAPGTASTTERAALARATALEQHANKALTKAMADHKPGDPPPAKLSDQFTTAIAAYKDFIAAYTDGPNVGMAIRQIMSIATVYAGHDAWDVADGIYADLQSSLAKGEGTLKIRRPERLEFARGLCQLGRAMPDHAREVLSALGTAGLGSEGDKEEAGPTALAMDDAKDAPADESGEMHELFLGTTTFTPGGRAGRGSGSSSGPGPGPGGQPAGGSFALAQPQFGGFAANAPAAPPAATPTPEPNRQPQSKPTPQAQRDSQLLAMIQRQERRRSSQVAQMEQNNREDPFGAQQVQQQAAQPQAQQYVNVAPAVPVLSEAELARLEKALDAAYAIFQNIRKNYTYTPTAQQARAEIFVMIGHWRSLTEWQRSAAMTVRFLADNPSDAQLPQLRLEVARDRLLWASRPIERKMTKQEMLAEVSARFAAARADLSKVIGDFPKERIYQQEAQWDLASSYLTEARAISAVSPTLAQGQFVRAARELRAVAVKYPKHPRIGTIPQLLWGISQELESREFEEEAILVWNELAIYDPLNGLAQQAMTKTAATYQKDLKRPLKAAETYLELNFIRGGNDQSMQNAVFQIGTSLKGEKRWVEALHVLETFVDSFPRHPQAGQALTMIGQIHQTNEAWTDAIAAYKRVIAEYKEAQWVQEAKWSIAECTINLSQWREAMAAYRDYATAYPGDSKVGEANRRIEVLKDLARYQGLVDEKGQRKAFDAQFQIAQIVRTQLANPVKGIIEYRKVVKNWPESYVAAQALYEIGTSYLAMAETVKAREALQAVAKDYPTSPLAGASMFMVGKSFEDEADRLATVTREKAVEQAKEVAQKEAYQQAQSSRRGNEILRLGKISILKSSGKGKAAELEEANSAFNYGQSTLATVQLNAAKAAQDVETLTATQMADRQDKINAALRKAIEAYASASKVPGGNKADAALLQMANIYDQRLKDSKAAMETWLEIVRQFSGTAVAEDASWKLAQYYERDGKHQQAIEAYNSFLRNYRRSPNAGAAQFAVAECYEHLGQWVAAMDSYNNYLNSYADGPLAAKAKEQINWIKTYRL